MAKIQIKSEKLTPFGEKFGSPAKVCGYAQILVRLKGRTSCTAPTIFYCLLQIEHGTVNILALGYDIQMMPPRNGEESLLAYLCNRLLHIYIV